MSTHEAQEPQKPKPELPKPDGARVIPLRSPGRPAEGEGAKEPLWRDLVGDVLRHERLAQERTLKDVADAARISMPYLSELERGRKEASSEVLAAAARALGLGLPDLLSLAQNRLAQNRLAQTRLAQTRPAGLPRVRPAKTSTSPSMSYQGQVRLAA